MINFDSLTLFALLNEIRPIIKNSRVQKIRQISRQELILTLRNNSKNYNLFISIKPSFAHLCILEEEYKQYRLIDIPPSPPMFCMLLRKYLENVKIEKVIQPEHERIIEFHFTAFGELGESIPLILAVELMGKHSNMILYNKDTKIILGCAHNVGEEKSKTRELAGNLPYIYPPKNYKTNIKNIDVSTFLKLTTSINIPFANWLNETFYDISMPLAKEICQKFDIPTEQNEITLISKDKMEKIFAELQDILSLNNIEPSISEDFEYFSINDIYQNKIPTTNAMVDLYFGKNSFAEKLYRKQKSLLSITDREIKKVKRLIKKLSLGSDFDEKILSYKQIADTLMANLHIDVFTDTIELQNIYTNEPITIEIDKTISLNQNAQNYYKLYSKSKKTKESNQILFEKYSEKENYLLSIKSAINIAENMDTLSEIEEETNLLTQTKQIKKTNQKTKKINIEMIEDSGYQIFIGKNNKQNDYIVSKIASAEDFWFHVHGDFGSHILVKSKIKTDTLPDKILLKAATLAAKYSERKNDKKVNVIYTKRKYIKKPSAGNLGYVTYKNEKEITVQP